MLYNSSSTVTVSQFSVPKGIVSPEKRGKICVAPTEPRTKWSPDAPTKMGIREGTAGTYRKVWTCALRNKDEGV